LDKFITNIKQLSESQYDNEVAKECVLKENICISPKFELIVINCNKWKCRC